MVGARDAMMGECSTPSGSTGWERGRFAFRGTDSQSWTLIRVADGEEGGGGAEGGITISGSLNGQKAVTMVCEIRRKTVEKKRDDELKSEVRVSA